MDTEKIRNGKPVEEILARLINTKTLSILMDGNCSRDTMENIFKALWLYMSKVDLEVMLYVLGDENIDDEIWESIYKKDLDNNVEIVDRNDEASVLSYIMGSGMLITDDEGSELLELAKDFYLPRVIARKRGSLLFEDGILNVNSSMKDICASFMLVKEKKHRDEMSGHKRLA